MTACRDAVDAIDDALTPAEAARRLRCSLPTLYRLMSKGSRGVRLNFLKTTGRKRVVPREDLAAFVRALTQQERAGDEAADRAATPEPVGAEDDADALEAELIAAGC